MRLLPTVVAVAALSLTGACRLLSVDDRAFACRADGDCVAGWVCGTSGFCEREESVDGSDAGPSDAGEVDAGPTLDPACGFGEVGRAVLSDGSTVVQLGSVRAEGPLAMAALADGALAIVGEVRNDDAVLPVDGFVLFTSPTGAIERCVRVASSTAGVFDHLVAVAALSDGDVVAVGTTDGDAGGTAATGSDVLVVRVSRAGDVRWARQYGFVHDEVEDDRDRATGVAVDGAGTIWVLGETSGWTPTHPERPGLFSGNAVLLALRDDGTLIDSRLVPQSPETSESGGIAARESGVVFAVTAPFDYRTGARDELFVSVFEAALDDGDRVALTLAWSVAAVGGFGSTQASSVTLDGDEIVVAGTAEGGVTIGGTSRPDQGDFDCFLASGPAGTDAPRVRLFGSPDVEQAWGLLARGGSRQVVGFTLSDAPGGPLVGGAGDAVGWRFPSGVGGTTSVWQVGGAGGDDARAIVGTADGVVVLGSTGSALVQQPWGDSDMFLLFRPDP